MKLSVKRFILSFFVGFVFCFAAYSQTVSNDAPTLGPVIRAYYEALKSKDDAAVVRILSSHFLAHVKKEMRVERKKGLAAFLAETDYRKDLQSIQVKNEILAGDKGTALIRGAVYKNWTLIGFVKEKGTWRISGENPAEWNLTPQIH